MKNSMDVLSAICDLVREEGGSIQGAQLFNVLYQHHPHARAVIGTMKPKQFVLQHPTRLRWEDGGCGVVFLQNSRNNSRTNKGDTVDKFYEAIRGDHALLTECEDVTGFKAAYARWRQEKQSNGDIIREPPSTILYRMIRKNLIQELFPGVDRNVLVFRGLRGNEANLTNRQRQKRAAERVHSQRGTIEKSSFLTWNDRRWA